MSDKKRCEWAYKSELSKKYHDEVWGIPCRDDNKLFKYLVLEVFQGGLSWDIIINKEKSFEIAFCDFDPLKVSNFGENEIEQIMTQTDIIKNEKKIRATIQNAKAFINVQQKYGSFSKYIWSYNFDTPVINNWEDKSEVPTSNLLSEKICSDMKEMGFEFIGPTTIYSYLQGIGIINDHLNYCDFKYID